ncbi:hypothetical protein TorRG33x02_071160 [Trema orientale]|uniref:Uncharacterized protein n=1 Tax=Trema orientale TaxID=63057 RepID=A0A2P5FH20_TREOI|nr:hypothetical protein TorRG33x02_071160 [Trema orientale]
MKVFILQDQLEHIHHTRDNKLRQVSCLVRDHAIVFDREVLYNVTIGFDLFSGRIVLFPGDIWFFFGGSSAPVPILNLSFHFVPLAKSTGFRSLELILRNHPEYIQ